MNDPFVSVLGPRRGDGCERTPAPRVALTGADRRLYASVVAPGVRSPEGDVNRSAQTLVFLYDVDAARGHRVEGWGVLLRVLPVCALRALLAAGPLDIAPAYSIAVGRAMHEQLLALCTTPDELRRCRACAGMFLRTDAGYCPDCARFEY